MTDVDYYGRRLKKIRTCCHLICKKSCKPLFDGFLAQISVTTINSGNRAKSKLVICCSFSALQSIHNTINTTCGYTNSQQAMSLSVRNAENIQPVLEFLHTCQQHFQVSIRHVSVQAILPLVLPTYRPPNVSIAHVRSVPSENNRRTLLGVKLLPRTP